MIIGKLNYILAHCIVLPWFVNCTAHIIKINRNIRVPDGRHDMRLFAISRLQWWPWYLHDCLTSKAFHCLRLTYSASDSLKFMWLPVATLTLLPEVDVVTLAFDFLTEQFVGVWYFVRKHYRYVLSFWSFVPSFIRHFVPSLYKSWWPVDLKMISRVTLVTQPQSLWIYGHYSSLQILYSY